MPSLFQDRRFLGVLIYFVIINLIGFSLMGLDKRRAIKQQWRIPERVLFTVAILFGSVGIHLGMKQFHHKTRHNSFVIGIPVIQTVQVILIVAIYLMTRS